MNRHSTIFLIGVGLLGPLSAYYAGWFPLHRWLYLSTRDLWTLFLTLFLGILVYHRHRGHGTVMKELVPASLGFVLLGVYGLLVNFFTSQHLSIFLLAIRPWVLPVLFVIIGGFGSLLNSAKASHVALKDSNNLLFLLVIMFLGSLGLYALSLSKSMQWSHLYFVSKNICLEGAIPEQWIEPIGPGLVRWAGLFMDPVNNGHFWVWALFALLYIPQQWSFWVRIFLILCSGTGLLLSFSKGSYLQFVAVLPIILAGLLIRNPRFHPRFRNALQRYLTPCYVFFPIVLVGLVYWGKDLHPGILNHWEGFEQTIAVGTFWGEGPGSHGQVAVLQSQYREAAIMDSAWGSMVGQFGYAGLIIWLGAWASLIFRIWPKNQGLGILLYVQIVLGLFSEAALYPWSMVALCLHVGAVLCIPASMLPMNATEEYSQ